MICPHCKHQIEEDVCARCGDELGEDGYRWRRMPGASRKGSRKRKVCPPCAEFLDTNEQRLLFVADTRGQEIVRPEKRKRAAA